MIIGLHGQKFAGKDTVATLLQEARPGMFERVALATPIKDAARLWFYMDALSEAEKEKIMPFWQLSPRDIWQILGTDVARALHPDVWILQGLDRAFELLNDCVVPTSNKTGFIIRHPSVVLITDVRFDNEARLIREAGGFVWHIKRTIEGTAVDTHASEAGVSSELIDLVIDNNNGSLEDLKLKALASFEQCRGGVI